MAERSNIEWCDSTFNPWIGCTKVSPACDHCYAEAHMDTRLGRARWGAGHARMRTADSYWRQPLRWNRADFRCCDVCGWRGEIAARMSLVCPNCGHDDSLETARRRVFCASLADVFDNEVSKHWRWGLFQLIRATPNLDWLLLTKRIGNAALMLDDAAGAAEGDFVGAATWTRKPWSNVWLGATICNQTEADRDIPKLLATPAAKRFVSIEPMLSHVTLPRFCACGCKKLASSAARDAMNGPAAFNRYQAEASIETTLGIDWVIAGGESGAHARPSHPDWFRSLRDQCAAAGVPFLFKQWGEWGPYDRGQHDSTEFATPNALDMPMGRYGKKLAGRLLDGITHDGFPA